MKLRAHIQRNERNGSKSITLTFPPENKMMFFARMEKIVERNIGPRPWSEISLYKNGHPVRIFVK